MAPRGSYRRHSVEFKLQLCSEIRFGKVGRRQAMRSHGLSANLLQLWLTQYDQGSLNEENAAASVVAELKRRSRRWNARWAS
jgi:transposase